MTTIQTTRSNEEVHHPHGGSSLERQELCTASYKAELPYENEDNEYSIRGRIMHTACEKNDVTNLSEEDADYCRWAMEKVLEICGEYNIVDAFREYKLTIHDNDGNKLNHGTADLLLLVELPDGNRKVVILDYKFGFGPVSVRGNIQCESYGTGACQEFGVTGCDYWIIQPALNYCAMDSFSDVQVPLARVEKIIENSEAEVTTFTPTKKGCQYCKHRLQCEARQEESNQLMLKVDQTIATMTPDEVADILDKVGVVEKLLEDMKKEAVKYVKNAGGTLEGRYRTITIKGRAKSLAVEDAYRIAPEHEIRKVATVSKTKLEKAYVEANYVKGENTKKALKLAFKTKVTPLLRYNNDTEKVVKVGKR